MTSIRWFRVVALAEAVSYLVLLAASVAKRALDAPELVTAVGPVHGLLFLAYVALALHVREQVGWTGWAMVTVVVAAALPLGALVVERRLPAGSTFGEPTPAPATAARGDQGGAG